MPEQRPELDVTSARDFDDHWRRLRILLEEPGQFAIQFVFSGNYELHCALLLRLQQTAQSLAVDCLELPKTSVAELADIHRPAPPITTQQLAEALTRHCLARIFPAAPPHPRLLLLDLHQALPAALAALLPEVACAADERQTRLQQALADSRALLLSRLNERRAQLAAFGPLLILLPEDWTKPAAQYAPDLWTQRLSSLYLAPPALASNEESSEPERAANPPASTASPRAAERNILARWQAALRTGQNQRLPISDGWIAAQTSALLGNGQEAEQIARLCVQLAYTRGGLREQMVSQGVLGDMRLRRGALEQAQEAYGVALTLAQRLVSNERDNTEWQRDLSVSYDKVADILRRSDPVAALDHYQASLKIRQDLARREPDNTEWQRDLSVSYNNVADIQRRSDPVAALVNYQASLNIRQDLARREPDNTQWQRDLSVSYEKVADILGGNDPAAALANYEASLKISQDLARREPDNTEWQRDLSVSYDKVADILRRSDPAAALVNYRASLKIAQDLARREPDSVQCQTDLVISYVKLAELHPLVSLADARAYLQAALDTALSLQQRGLLDLDQADWPTDIRQRLDALPLA